MIFLIEYNRSAGNIVDITQFDDSQRQEAENLRLKIELDINRKGEGYEVVLLEAESEEALRRTHQRYFDDLRQILSKKMDMPDYSLASHSDGGLNSDTELAQ